MPASQANPEVVSAFRREEREQTTRLTDKYLRICFASKVFVLLLHCDLIHYLAEKMCVRV